MNEVPKLGSGNYPANVRFWVWKQMPSFGSPQSVRMLHITI